MEEAKQLSWEASYNTDKCRLPEVGHKGKSTKLSAWEGLVMIQDKDSSYSKMFTCIIHIDMRKERQLF